MATKPDRHRGLLARLLAQGGDVGRRCRSAGRCSPSRRSRRSRPRRRRGVPVSTSSLSSWPGVRRCTCGSKKAGNRVRPSASITSAPVGLAGPRLGELGDLALADDDVADRVEPRARVEHPGAADHQGAGGLALAAAPVERGDRGRRPPSRRALRSGSASGSSASAVSPAPAWLAAAGEQLVEDRHPDHEAALDLGGDQRGGAVDHLGRELDPAVDRARVHEQLARARAGASRSGSWSRTRGSRGRRCRSSARAASAARRRRRPRRGRRACSATATPSAASIPRGIRVGGPQTVTSAPDLAEAERAGAGDAAVEDVADDPDPLAARGLAPLALERAEAVEQRVGVEQRLARVLVLAVAGVDRPRPSSSSVTSFAAPGVRGADDDRLRPVGGEGRDRVLQRLALVDRRAAST